jgi:AraC-like DNA-binding protein
MAYNYGKIFSAVNKHISKNPMIPLYRLSQKLECSHPTIEKAVLLNTSLSFRDYRKQKLLQRILALAQEGHSRNDISMEVGYKWPEHLSRFIRAETGRTLVQLMRDIQTQHILNDES